MEEKKIRKDREEEIEFFEEALKVQFPQSYCQFLLTWGSAIIDGRPIFGIPTKEVETSVFQATEVLRKARPDLSTKKLVAICFNKGRALCLDTERTHREDCLLIDVSLKLGEPSIEVRHYFKEWIDFHERMAKRFTEAYLRVQKRRKEAEEWRKRRMGGKRGFLPRPQDWHPIVSEVQDYTVGLAAMRYNPRFNAVEVDEFFAFDHPKYQAGGAVRNLANIVFTMARDFCGSLNIIFTKERRDEKPSFFRPSRPIPRLLVNLAKEYGITFKEEIQGRISHQEGVNLYFGLLEFSTKAREIAEKLEEANCLSKEMITEVIAVGIWSREEVIWLLENTSRPEAVILGTDLPENRVFHADSLNYGRSVLLAKRFQQVVLVEITGGFSSEERETPECLLEPQGRFWTLKSAKEFHLPWKLNREEKVLIEAKEPILIFSRPRIIGSQKENEEWILKNVSLLEEAKKKQNTRIACLVLNYEFASPDFGQNVEKIKQIVEELSQKGIYLCIPYERCDQLDLEVEGKMRRARKMRQFPFRSIPLVLEVVEIPKEEWKVEKMFGHVVQKAYDFGRYIANKVNITRYRDDFLTCCDAVERMAFEKPERRIIAELEESESQEILETLRLENGISYSFVRPEEMSEFLNKLKKETRSIFQSIQGGVVFLAKSYEKVEAPIVKVKISRVQVEIPEQVKVKINKETQDKINRKEYLSREIEIKSVHQQIQESLIEGLPLAVSYIQPGTFVEAIREYICQPTITVYHPEIRHRQELRYKTEMVEKSFFGKLISRIRGESLLKEVKAPYYEAIPCEVSVPYKEPLVSSATLRIVYNDGSEGEPFPIFCLEEDFQPDGQFYEFPAQLVSLRHMLADYATEVSLIRNVEIQRKEDSADQEEFAFRKTCFFIENFLKLIRDEISIDEVSEKALIFKVLWNSLDLKNQVPKNGLKIHLFQSTGLEPAVVGAYRAAMNLLQKYRGKLIVVPRIYNPNEQLNDEFKKAYRSLADMETKRKIVSGMYFSAKDWQ